MLSVIIPAYNEKSKINKTIIETVSVLDSASIPYEIVVVDDGSKDGTYHEALTLTDTCRNLRVHGYSPNRGKGYAVRYGVKNCNGENVLILDADSDLPPSQLNRFYGYMQQNGADIIIGSKWHPESNVEFPPLRRFLSRCYGTMLKILFGLQVSDTQTGIKMFKRQALDKLLPHLTVDRFAFDIELLASAARHGYVIKEVPIELRFGNHSRVNTREIVRIFTDTMNIYFKMRRNGNNNHAS